MEKLKLPTYGGQAVIEGVMMRGKQNAAIAMRAPDESIVIHQEELGEIYRSRLLNIPFLRGIIMLWDALGMGLRALTISANTQTGEDEKIEGPQLILTLIVSLAFAIGLFFLLPALAGHLFCLAGEIKTGVNQFEIREPHVFQRPRRGADVAGLLRLNKNE